MVGIGLGLNYNQLKSLITKGRSPLYSIRIQAEKFLKLRAKKCDKGSYHKVKKSHVVTK